MSEVVASESVENSVAVVAAEEPAKKAKKKDDAKSFLIVLAAGVFFCYDGDRNIVGRHRASSKLLALEPSELAKSLLSASSVQGVAKNEDGSYSGKYRV